MTFDHPLARHTPDSAVTRSLLAAAMENQGAPNFGGMSGSERDKWLRRYLVQRCYPVVVDAAHIWDRWTNIVYPRVQQQKAGNDGSDPEEVLRRAAEIYYSENRFVVRHDLLPHFLDGAWSNITVAMLVRNITVTIDVELCNIRKEGRAIAGQLERLSHLGVDKTIAIELLGSGPLNGSDWATQEAIRWLSPIVRSLMERAFSDFRILKVTPNGKRKELGPYWHKLGDLARDRTWDGDECFDVTMRKQIQSWAIQDSTSM
ncbi:hypothetical protein PCL_10531 [Purpureocillium lilacinum]|uniref:Uncharacterized protein n=1 Tax=Purpureocillium lilacinum TaxID=33203 RepID=A0A2U3DQ34_PURLI|nr:hypothetical protein PCL_10531 [Purpureocillium lilacinum]